MRNIPEGFVIPDFGSDKAAPTATPTQTQSSATPVTGAGNSSNGPRKFVLICSKGNLDMAYPGLVLANAAIGEGIETHIFFTFWGLDIINKKTMNNLKFTMVGNTAMHMADLGRLRPGLEHVSMPQLLGSIPGMTGFATKMMKKQIEELDIPAVPEFLDLLSASGVHMWVCRMSFDMTKMIEADMHEGVEGVISATDFMELSEGAQTLFI